MERECVPLTALRQPERFHVCFGPFALILLVFIRDSNMRHVFQDTQKEPWIWWFWNQVTCTMSHQETMTCLSAWQLPTKTSETDIRKTPEITWPLDWHLKLLYLWFKYFIVRQSVINKQLLFSPPDNFPPRGQKLVFEGHPTLLAIGLASAMTLSLSFNI